VYCKESRRRRTYEQAGHLWATIVLVAAPVAQELAVRTFQLIR